ncbi:MAG TPA: hypothetical protein VK838_03540, partial [Candidatus Limnocylindrales bacterium]|nr:hypothetical protein [Candidatus Limnocylindrales bacterium]
MEGGQEWRRAARLGSVVTHLQQVDRADEPAGQQRTLHRRLGVAGQQRADGTALQQHDHRSVVDVAVRQRS